MILLQQCCPSVSVFCDAIALNIFLIQITSHYYEMFCATKGKDGIKLGKAGIDFFFSS